MAEAEPFKNRVWRCISCGIIGSCVGAFLLTAGFPLVDSSRHNLRSDIYFVITIAPFVALVSLVFTVPSGLLILLPIEMRSRRALLVRPARTTIVMVSIAAAAGKMIVLLLGLAQSWPLEKSDDWTGLLGAIAMTLPFSISAMLALAWPTHRAIRREVGRA